MTLKKQKRIINKLAKKNRKLEDELEKTDHVRSNLRCLWNLMYDILDQETIDKISKHYFTFDSSRSESDSNPNPYKMNTYYAKPCSIKAIRFAEDGSNWQECFVELGDTDWHHTDQTPSYIDIHTLEGTMKCNRGDWIIQGLEGEFYPCKNSVFINKYQ